MAVKGNIRSIRKQKYQGLKKQLAQMWMVNKKKGPKWSQFNTLGEVQFVILSIELATQTRRWRPAKI